MSGNLLTEQAFAETIAANGGRVFRVGGCVRDMFMGITPQDIDFCITGMVKKNFKTLFPEAEECSKAFPVFRLLIDGQRCEAAFARTERKVGSGHKGFKVASNPKITIEEDLLRRDTTVNAIAVDCLNNEVIDPFNGRRDIKDSILRATGKHFAEDPIRALRLAGQAARFGFEIESGTVALASTVAVELAAEPVERLLAELMKVLAVAQQPARFFKALAAAQLLPAAFSEISGLSQAEFDTAMANLDAVARVTPKPKLRFAALGLALDQDQLRRWNNRMTLPGDWLAAAVIAGNTAAFLAAPSPDRIVDAVNRLRRGALSIEEFDIIATAASLSLPELTPVMAVFALLPEDPVAKTLQGEKRGEWLRQKQIEAIANR
ncbi:polynucleotide adenylyltransferase [Sporomusa sp.]|uniref:polynucleotide adenylyltransferase n=1 Tax=Sporomusa sp. TaxID=2078658 RepID=UPI002BF0A1FD|nr:polynucleotide adenylyltransferase [Sporomusa sp.]HWR09359.1 polynucleotide adenylyltransferase [Sporomusa sp.]